VDTSAPSHDPDALALLAAGGADAVSFQALERAMQHWRDAPPPTGSGALVAYADTGSAWVAAGRPIAADPDQIERAAARFVAAAEAAGRRACFFAAEAELPGCDRMLLGEQPVFEPGAWSASLANHRSLREQLRRARAKGVSVREVDPAELVEGAPLRAEVDRLAAEWLGSRRMEPMGFLVALEPFHAPDQHRYLAAERGGQLVAFLSAVPIYARRGWLVEDVLRGRDAPNGTTEALLDAFMRGAGGAEVVTLGLAPLSGPIARWQRLARALARPLYDFRGVRAFKARLHPSGWEQVWMAYPRRGSPLVHLVDSLRAFASGSLLRFGALTVARHPGAPPWILAVPLVPWAALLAFIAASGNVELLSYSRAALAGWAGFDAFLAAVLFQIAFRPRARSLVAAACAAGVDALLSVWHRIDVGFGHGALQLVLRSLATAAPVVGTAALAWAARRAFALERSGA
jgi:phosphatidylglycerol lysyltransferase